MRYEQQLERMNSSDSLAYLPLFANNLADRGKSPATISDYSRDARKFAQYLQQHRFELQHLDAQVLEQYCQHLHSEYGNASNSVRRKVFGIRQFFDFLCAKKVIATNPFQAFSLPKYIDKPSDAYRSLDIENIIAFLRERKLNRQLAILYLLAYEGIKASELTALRWQDFIQEKQSAILMLRGGRRRTIHLQRETTSALLAHGGNCRTGSIFSGERGPRRDELTRHGLKFMLYQLAQQTSSAPISCEKLRSHAIAFQLAQKHSATAVMAHLGLRRVGVIKKHLPKLRV